MSTDDETSPGLTPETIDLMDWVESGTVARRQVTIHNNPALLEEYEALEAQLKEAEKRVRAAGGDEALSDSDPREAILDAMADLYDRWEASKAVWTVRALAPDDVQATFDPDTGVPEPRRPVPPLEKAGKKAHEDFVEAVGTYSKAKAKADGDRQLHLISAAVVSVETPRGTATAASVEVLEKMRARPHGQQWIDRLYAAVQAATEGDVEIPRPTSREGSTTPRASSSR